MSPHPQHTSSLRAPRIARIANCGVGIGCLPDASHCCCARCLLTCTQCYTQICTHPHPNMTCSALATSSPTRARPHQCHTLAASSTHQQGALTAAVRSAQARPRTGCSQSLPATLHITCSAPRERGRGPAGTVCCLRRARAAMPPGIGAPPSPAPRERGCGFEGGAEGNLLREDVPAKGVVPACFMTDMIHIFFSTVRWLVRRVGG